MEKTIEIAKVKEIIGAILEQDFNTKRLKPLSRMKHLKSQIFFKIDNPDYVRKEKLSNG